MEHYTARELAARLGVRVETIYRYARSRQIPAVRVGGTWRFPKDELERWFQDGGRREGRQPGKILDAKSDPLLRVIGIGSDGRMTQDIDRHVYGARP